MKVGVLALQGAFAKHFSMLKALDCEPLLVRYPEELKLCGGLIIPGGESTTMIRLLERHDLFPALTEFSRKKPLFGTCAGLILMAHQLGVLDVVIERNAYGSQIDSFTEEIVLEVPEKKGKQSFPAVFIRAPRIKSFSSEVQVLGLRGDEPVLVQQGHHMAATFHPELTDNTWIHRHFLNLAKK